MTSSSVKLILSVIALLTLSITSAQAAKLPAELKPIQQNSLCKLFGLSCPTMTAKTGGKGKEPDLPKKQDN